ncbi:MAG: pilus assembly protein TadE [Micromonosporaceae bacterium]|nr:pilus assembly protein TadE [Micromonosporaceae bacterium]
MTTHPRRERGGRDRGAVSVEFAIAAPLVLFLLLLIVQFALWAHATHIAQAAANAGVQATRVHGGSTAAGHEQTQAVLEQMAGSTLTDPAVSVARTATDATVTVDGAATEVLPGLSLPVHASVTAPREIVPGTP